MVMRKVASSPIITISSSLSPSSCSKQKKMIHHHQNAAPSRRRSSTRTGTGHRRQVTPDSVATNNILCSQSFTDEYLSSSGSSRSSSSASSATAAAQANSSDGGLAAASVATTSSSPLLRPTTSSSTPGPQIDDHQSLQLRSILSLESSPHYSTSPHYLHSSILLKDRGVSEKCRRKTCEWMYQLCDYFVLQREVVGIALFYVDRYFTITFGNGDDHHQPVTKKEFQLVGLTALYVAIKTHGQSRPSSSSSSCCVVGVNNDTSFTLDDVSFNKLKFSLHVCASTSREQFTPRQIEECECKMLHTLEWRLNPIVPSGCVIELLVMFLPCANGEKKSSSSGVVLQNFVYDCATYLTELAVSVAALSLVYKPSVIAYASILAAVDILLGDEEEDDTSPPSSRMMTKDMLIEYEALLNQASCRHFELNKEDVFKAKEILGVMAPNVGELFPSPFGGGGEPTLLVQAGNELL